MRVAPALFLLAWGGNHFTPLLHVYESIGHYEPWQANLLLGMYVFGIVPGMMIAAAHSDRHGRKPAFLAGVVASLLGSALLGAGLHSLVLLCLGRVVAGVGVGVAMSVGTAWLKELSSPPFDPHAGPIAGTRRPALTMTLGFALGAGVTGCLAQFAPAPTLLPYLLHGGMTVVSLVLACWAPESRTEIALTGPWWEDLRVPRAKEKLFIGVIVPAGPWVFAAAGVAYAIVPSSVEHRLGDMTTIFATVLTVLTLGTGAVVQALAPRVDRATGGRALQTGLIAMTCGMLLAVAATWWREPWFAAVVAIVLGGAYGLCVISGLGYVQRMATPDDLAGLTGIFYALTYVGFLLPALLAALLPVMPYPASLAIVAAICALCWVIVQRNLRLHR